MKRRWLSILAALALCLGLLPGTAGAVPSSDQIIIGDKVLTLSEGEWVYAMTAEDGAVTVGDGSEGWNIAVTLYNGNMFLYLNDANITGSPETEYGLGIGYWGTLLNITLHGDNSVTGVEAPGPNTLYSLYAQGDLAISGQDNATLTVYGATVQKDDSAYPNGLSASGIVSTDSISINQNVIVRAYSGVTNSEDSHFPSRGISANGDITFGDNVQVFAEGRESSSSTGIFCGKRFSAGNNAKITATASGAVNSTAITAAYLSVYENAQVIGQAMDATESSMGFDTNYPPSGVTSDVAISNDAQLRLSAGESPKSYALRVRTDTKVNFYGGYFLLTGTNQTGYDYAFCKLGGWSDNYIWRTDENDPYRAKPLYLDTWNTAYPYIEIKTGYLVMLYPNSGKIAEGKDVTCYAPGEEVALPTEADMTREGYLFDGWYQNRDLSGDPVTAITKTDEGEKRLYAKWVPCHTVTFDSQGGGDVESQTVKEGGTAAEPAGLTRVGYILEGWYKEGTFENLWDFETDTVTEDVTLYAKWTEKNYTVTFDTNGGSEITSQTVGANGTAVKPADPSKSGYIFGGWYKEADCETPWSFESGTVTADLTLYAKWTPKPVDPPPAAKTHTVRFLDGGTELASLTVREGSKAAPPDEPVKQGYRFAGWYTDPEGTEAFDFETPVTGDLTLYAKWTALPGGEDVPSGGGSSGRDDDDDDDEPRPPAATTTTVTQNPDGSTTKTTTDRRTGTVTTVTTAPDGTSVTVVTDRNGHVVSTEASVPKGTAVLPAAPEGEVKITVKGGGRAEVTLPAENAGPGTVAVLVSPEGTETVVRKSILTENGVVLTVQGSAVVRLEDRGRTFPDVPEGWKAEAAAFVSAREILNGGTDGLFRPDAPMTRAMLAVALHNLEGNPSHGTAAAFLDVPEHVWYAEAVSWASARGIVTGYTGEIFGPGDRVTREQLAVILWRAAGRPAPSSRVLPFPDADQAADYAREALCWAVEHGIIHGGSGGTLDPKGLATRAQTAQMLKNFLENG